MADRRGSAFAGGTVIGTLGGLIGLGGAEFRLPLLIGYFRFAPLEAIILNKATSLIVVASALVFRTRAVSIELIATHLDVVANLLAGSLIGAWLGASWATRMKSATLYKVIAILLVAIAIVLLLGHERSIPGAALNGWHLYLAGALAGLVIGVVASLMGVAGGELLIPTLVLLFGLDIKLAGASCSSWQRAPSSALSSVPCCSDSLPGRCSIRSWHSSWFCRRSRSGGTHSAGYSPHCARRSRT